MSLPPRGWGIPEGIHPTEEGATVGPDYLTIGASGGPGLHDHCHEPRPRLLPIRGVLAGTSTRRLTEGDLLLGFDRHPQPRSGPGVRQDLGHGPLDLGVLA